MAIKISKKPTPSEEHTTFLPPKGCITVRLFQLMQNTYLNALSKRELKHINLENLRIQKFNYIIQRTHNKFIIYKR